MPRSTTAMRTLAAGTCSPLGQSHHASAARPIKMSKIAIAVRQRRPRCRRTGWSIAAPVGRDAFALSSFVMISTVATSVPRGFGPIDRYFFQLPAHSFANAHANCPLPDTLGKVISRCGIMQSMLINSSSVNSFISNVRQARKCTDPRRRCRRGAGSAYAAAPARCAGRDT
ncbi:hypothetical protein D3C81_1333440 [compost metagenome]